MPFTYIDYTNITDDVVPPNPNSYYSHYEADDGKIYIDICISYKTNKNIFIS